jgi:hypothetical protein
MVGEALDLSGSPFPLDERQKRGALSPMMVEEEQGHDGRKQGTLSGSCPRAPALETAKRRPTAAPWWPALAQCPPPSPGHQIQPRLVPPGWGPPIYLMPSVHPSASLTASGTWHQSSMCTRHSGYSTQAGCVATGQPVTSLCFQPHLTERGPRRVDDLGVHTILKGSVDGGGQES